MRGGEHVDAPRGDPLEETVLDGNAVAGMLAAVFGSDMTPCRDAAPTAAP